MANPDRYTAWAAIEAHRPKPLVALFSDDPGRVANYGRDVSGIHFDWSKTHLDDALVADFEALAGAAGYDAAREALFSGAVVNPTEGRAATHVAERGQGGADDNRIASTRLRMRICWSAAMRLSSAPPCPRSATWVAARPSVGLTTAPENSASRAAS